MPYKMTVLIKPKNYYADIKVPNIRSPKFDLSKSNYPFYEILCGVIHEIKTDKIGNIIEGKKIDRLQNLIMFEISNKIQSTVYFNDLLKNYIKDEILENNETFLREQNILAILEAYLNSLHSLRDFMKLVDDITKYDYVKEKFNNRSLFAFIIDIRNIFHHNQSPFINVENGHINIKFNLLPKHPQRIQIIPKDNNGYYGLKLNINKLTSQFLDDFNNWSKRYLDLFDNDTKVIIFTKMLKNDKWDTEEKTIAKLITEIN